MSYAVKAVQEFFVAGRMVTPGGIAEVSAHEACNLYGRGVAVPAESADVADIVSYPVDGVLVDGVAYYAVSGTVDPESIQTIKADREGAAMLVRSKSVAELAGGA